MANSGYTPPPNGFRTFVIVWVTQAISVFGSALTHFAVNIWMVTELYPLPEQKPELAMAISVVSLAFGLPTLLLAPVAGAWADRHDRKRTMMIADAASGVLTLGLMVMVASGALQLWSLVLFSIAGAAFGSFHGSAFDTSYAMLVPEAQLPRANGMMQTIWSLSGVLSPAAAAALISLPALARQGSISGELGNLLASIRSGATLAMGVDAVTFFIAAAALIFLFVPSPVRKDLSAPGGQRKSIWIDVRDGARFIWHRRPMLWLLGSFTLANFVFSPLFVFLPLLVKFNLAADWNILGFTIESAMATVSTVSSVGGIVGGVLISAWGGLKHHRVYVVLGGIMAVGALVGFVGLASSFVVVGVLSFLIALVLPITNAHSQAIWQSITPRELQGRVFAVRRVIAQCAGPISTALAGVLGGVFNPGTVLAVMNFTLVVLMIIQLFNPVFLKVEDRDYLEALAAKAELAEAA